MAMMRLAPSRLAASTASSPTAGRVGGGAIQEPVQLAGQGALAAAADPAVVGGGHKGR
jgi:hypothetical protein